MAVMGIVLIAVLPYMAGYIIKTLMNSKETGQIETYLTGFFFIFLLQGLFFSVGYMVLNRPFDMLCRDFKIVLGLIVIAFVIVGTVNLVLIFIKGKKEIYRAKLKNDEWILLGIMLVIAALIVARVFCITDYIRDDYMLPTVRMTVSTHTINEFNPITGRPYELGLITSRKIITLPVYYAFLCCTFGIDTLNLLYVIMTLQTVACTYLSCMFFITPILKVRSRIYMFGIFLGAIILSGDYFMNAIGAKLLWRGYAGDTIVAAVILPYALALVVGDYRQVFLADKDQAEYKKEIKRIRIQSIFKLILVSMTSLFITSVAKGLLIIAITVVLALVCYIVAIRKQMGVDDGSLFLGE